MNWGIESEYDNKKFKQRGLNKIVVWNTIGRGEMIVI